MPGFNRMDLTQMMQIFWKMPPAINKKVIIGKVLPRVLWEYLKVRIKKIRIGILCLEALLLRMKKFKSSKRTALLIKITPCLKALTQVVEGN